MKYKLTLKDDCGTAWFIYDSNDYNRALQDKIAFENCGKYHYIRLEKIRN